MWDSPAVSLDPNASTHRQRKLTCSPKKLPGWVNCRCHPLDIVSISELLQTAIFCEALTVNVTVHTDMKSARSHNEYGWTAWSQSGNGKWGSEPAYQWTSGRILPYPNAEQWDLQLGIPLFPLMPTIASAIIKNLAWQELLHRRLKLRQVLGGPAWPKCHEATRGSYIFVNLLSVCFVLFCFVLSPTFACALAAWWTSKLDLLLKA